MVLPNCTNSLQPLDVSDNELAKGFLRQKFHSWYALNVCAQLERKTPKEPVNLRSSVLKTLGATWMVEMYDFLKSKLGIIRNGFKETEIFIVPHFNLHIYQEQSLMISDMT